MIRPIAATIPISALVLLLGACAVNTQGDTRRSQDVITQEELQTVQVSNLYEAVQRLRPRWIAVRSQQSFSSPTQVVVYQNQTLIGGPETLRDLTLGAAAWIQYLDGPTASATLPGIGTRQVEGAIVIHTSGGPR